MFDVVCGLLMFVIIGLSLSHMWSHSAVLARVRFWVTKIPYIRVPLLCPECCSFWIGFGLSFLFNPFLGLSILGLPVLSNVLLGLVLHLFASPLYGHDILTDNTFDYEEDS